LCTDYSREPVVAASRGSRLAFGNTMTVQEYSVGVKRLSRRYTVLFCLVVLVGTAAALYLTDALANSSSWARESVFFAMLPALLAPTIIAGALLEYADRRIGLKCPSCGHSLSFGRHVRRLLRDGGACPWCRTVVVEAKRDAEPGAPPNGGPAMPSGNSGIAEGPPSVG
jgi:hypothetical protein